jgi:hypothetical protein
VDDAEIAREVNRRTVDVILRFDAGSPPDDLSAEFLCECGCLSWVSLPLARFFVCGAVREEHRAATA